MTAVDLQPVWQLTGSSAQLSETMGIDVDTTLDLHAGMKSYHDSRMEGDALKMILSPEEVPNPLLVLAMVDIFDKVDIFPNLSPGIIVNAHFIAHFDEELKESRCREFGVRVVMYDGTSATATGNREYLLKRTRPNLYLYAIIPTIAIATQLTRENPSRSVLYVPSSEKLPPFFLVPWSGFSVWVRDDIKQRIDASGLRGAKWNLAPWP